MPAKAVHDGPGTIADDCFAHDRDRLTHDEAIAILRERMAPVTVSETVPLDQAAGRIAAEPVIARHSVPGRDNSAVDGYAFAAAQYEACGGFFPVLGRIAAGDEATPVNGAGGGAVRIFTGAPMPDWADTVAMQEDCEPHRQDGLDFVIIPPGLKPGANRRRAGEDLQPGDTLIDAGRRLRPQELASVASTGLAEIAVHKPLAVALASTGDEIVPPGNDKRADQNYDANRVLLTAMADRLPVTITDLGILPDRREVIEQTLTRAARTHDAVITSGGASLGDEDHVVATLDRHGVRHLWQLAIKPGRPLCFGQIGKTLFFGLPGNPVASFVCFLLYVRPALLALAGAPWREPRRYPLPAGFDFPNKKPGRREFWRAQVVVGEDGRALAHKFPRDGSGLITGLTAADGLIEVGEDVTEIAQGDPVSFIPFGEFGVI